MPQVFYVDHTWQQILNKRTFWDWECVKCGELCKHGTIRGNWIYKVREPEDTRGKLCVVIENDWRE